MLKKAPKQQRSEQMVACILAGATRVFDTISVAQTTTNHIAEVAGVSIGSLYQYFDSKEAIAQCLLLQHLDETIAILRNARVASRGYRIEERMRMPFVEVVRDHRRSPGLHLNLMGLTQRNEAGTLALKDRIDRIVDEIAFVLAEERPEVLADEIGFCATLQHQNAEQLAHATIRNPCFDRDSVVMDYFDALCTATVTQLDRTRRERARTSPIGTGSPALNCFAAAGRLQPDRPNARSSRRRAC